MQYAAGIRSPFLRTLAALLLCAVAALLVAAPAAAVGNPARAIKATNVAAYANNATGPSSADNQWIVAESSVTARAGHDLAGVVARLRPIFVAAETGGAASVRLGQAGEAAVRGSYDIGPKATRVIGGRTRIFDGLNDTAVSEVKNVGYQAYTQQLKDSLAYAQQNGLQFNLYVRGSTTLSGPLQNAIATTPGFNLEFIP